MVYAPVFPVPFLARARMSRPNKAPGMAASCMGEGFSQPFSKIPIKSERDKQNSSKVLPLVAVTSEVLIRLSLAGIFNLAFQLPSSEAVTTVESEDVRELDSCFLQRKQTV